MKLLKENLGKTLFDINCRNFFFRSVTLGKGNKSKITKCDLIKLKRFFTVKETTDKPKR